MIDHVKLSDVEVWIRNNKLIGFVSRYQTAEPGFYYFEKSRFYKKCTIWVGKPKLKKKNLSIQNIQIVVKDVYEVRAIHLYRSL